METLSNFLIQKPGKIHSCILAIDFLVDLYIYIAISVRMKSCNVNVFSFDTKYLYIL
jgi:hypothetical protein